MAGIRSIRKNILKLCQGCPDVKRCKQLRGMACEKHGGAIKPELK